jgi:uncharacterized protein YoxC
MKKLVGDTNIEDSLWRLDRLTQEEKKMAAAEQLKMTHNVERKVIGVDKRVQDVEGDVKNVGKMVQGVDDGVQDVHDKVQGVDDKVQAIDEEVKDVGERVQGVDRRLDNIDRSLSLRPPASHYKGSDPLTGNLLRDNLLRWLSPSDPSTNHNIACKAHHDGTTQWFFQGSIFKEWKNAGPFLWVHGKREFPEALLRVISPDHLCSIAGSGKSVLRFVVSRLVLPYLTYMVNSAPRSFKIS